MATSESGRGLLLLLSSYSWRGCGSSFSTARKLKGNCSLSNWCDKHDLFLMSLWDGFTENPAIIITIEIPYSMNCWAGGYTCVC